METMKICYQKNSVKTIKFLFVLTYVAEANLFPCVWLSRLRPICRLYQQDSLIGQTDHLQAFLSHSKADIISKYISIQYYDKKES